MSPEWIGRKLAQAANALAARFAFELEEDGPGPFTLPPVAGSFLEELGRWLARSERDPLLPLLRARGVLRLPATADSAGVLREFARLERLVRGHVAQLPGAAPELDRSIRAAFAAAARTVAEIHAALRAGRRNLAAERRFGGIAVLRFVREDRRDLFPPLG